MRVAGIVSGSGMGFDLAQKMMAAWRRSRREGAPSYVLRESAFSDADLDAVLAQVHGLATIPAAFAVVIGDGASSNFAAMSASSPIPLLDTVSLTCQQVVCTAKPGARVGVLGTAMVHEAYAVPLRAMGFKVIPLDALTFRSVDEGIDLIRRRGAADGERAIQRARKHLLTEGAEVIVLACAEVPLVFAPGINPTFIDCRPTLMIDTTAVLAEEIVRQIAA